MSVSGDSADQMVQYYFKGLECVATISGKGAEHVLAVLVSILKNKKQTKGKTRLNNMLKSGKALKIFSIKKEDLRMFQSEAKRYGILYSALIDKKNQNFDGMVDIMVREEDASRINRIVERFKLTTVDTAKIQTEVQKSIDERKEKESQNPKDKGVQEKSKEELLEDVLAQKPIQKENEQIQNFNSAMTAKSPQSERSLNRTEGVSKPLNKKKSVRKELAEIKEEVRKEAEIKAKAQTKVIKENAIPKQKAPKVKDAR